MILSVNRFKLNKLHLSLAFELLDDTVDDESLSPLVVGDANDDIEEYALSANDTRVRCRFSVDDPFCLHSLYNKLIRLRESILLLQEEHYTL